MKVEYKYINGKAIVTDEDGYPEVLEYSDTLDDILSQRNLLEEIEIKMDELVEDIGVIELNMYEINKHKSGLFIKFLITLTILALSILVPIATFRKLIFLISLFHAFSVVIHRSLVLKKIHELKKSSNSKGV